MQNTQVKSTPLRDEHIKLGAKMVDFAGWYMPVEYAGLRLEHLNVRENVGLFDVSHMGEIRVTGEKSLATLQWMFSNDVSTIGPGQAQYGLLTNLQGGVVDDLIVYCVEKDRDYLLCVNAANVEKDWQWIQTHNRGASLKNESSEWGQIAVQGPKACALVAKLFGQDVLNINAFQFAPRSFKNGLCYLARTGYTGEDGFEIFVPSNLTVSLWQDLISAGQEYKVQPIGLGARDTLRTEMKYSLYGQEINDVTNPYEAGLGWTLKPNAKDFIGRDLITAYKASGLKKKLVGFKMIDKGIPRHGYKLVSIDKNAIGEVTSGTVSPTLGENIGIGYVAVEMSDVGQEFFVDIRGRLAKAVVVETPFVQTSLTKKASAQRPVKKV